MTLVTDRETVAEIQHLSAAAASLGEMAFFERVFDEVIEPDAGVDRLLGIPEVVGELEREPEIEGDLPYPVFGVEQHIVGLGKGR